MWMTIARRGGVWPWLLALCAVANAQDAYIDPNASEITLSEAFARTIARNPELTVLGYQRAGLEGALTQARLLPNPELDVQLQDAFGTGIHKALDASELTVSLAWVLERGVREHRIDAAGAAVAMGDADAAVVRLDVAAETARRYIECLAFQARLAWSAEAVALARETIEAVGIRVDAGRAPAAELARAEAELARTELVQEDYEHELLSALHRLSAQWGETEPDFGAVAGDVSNLPVLESFEAITERMYQNPDLERYASQERLYQAELSLAEARARPAWRLSGGVRRIEATDDFALVGGISIPLAVRNRNEGQIASARANLARTSAERAAAEVQLETTLFALRQELNHYLQTVRRLRQDIVPRLEQALVDTRRAFELGRYSYLDWQAVQRELLEANASLLENSIGAHRIAIEIERLTGVALAPAITAQ
jgi:cobalt-zinc-cadmium efflux system outer membrane protein